MTQQDPWRGSSYELYAPTRPESTTGQPYAAPTAPSSADPWAPTTSLPATDPYGRPTQGYASFGQYPATQVIPEPTYQSPEPTFQVYAPQAPAYPQPVQRPAPAYPVPQRPMGWYPVAYQAPAAPPKSSGVAYLLWFFFGLFGVHHFYLGRTGWGVAYLLSTLLLGWLGLGVILVMVGCFIDLFLIPSYTRDANRRLTGYPY